MAKRFRPQWILSALLGALMPLAANGSPVAIVIHGGAGTILKSEMSAEREEALRIELATAARAGHRVLEEGGDSLTAVRMAIRILEDSPLFNAGRGAVFTHDGNNELDASVMLGKDRSAGAVAGVRRIKNPIDLAVRVMQDSPHVLLVGDGAEAFAASQDIELVDPDYFHTDYRWQQLQKMLNGEQAHAEYRESWFSTVGAVALDRDGNLTAGTSTGGTANKRWGRVGDSPIIGAGTYADNHSCAVSATGHGEYFIRAAVAHDICARMAHGNQDLATAAHGVVMEDLVAMGGDGGVIAMDPQGNIQMVFNTPGMYRAAINTDGQLLVGIYKGDEWGAEEGE